MITPKYLKSGDCVGIIASARKITHKEIKPAIDKFNEWGLEVVLGNNIEISDQFAGNDMQRTEDFQNMINNNNVKAVIVARGGYGTVRIIDKIDFTNFIKNPKWILGYSDVTVLHSHIHNNFGVETIHSTMPLNFPHNGVNNNSLITLKNALFGEKLDYNIGSKSYNKSGYAAAVLTGGNLSMLYALSATPSDIDTNGKILFIEDLDEYLYHIDRMMMQLKRSGKLEKLAGLIVGGMTEMRDNTIPFGKTACQIIAEAVKDYNYPVCYDFPAGHIDDNRALILGRNVKLNVSETYVELEF